MNRDSEAIYLLAFDHRGSFQKKLLGIAGEPTPSDVERIKEAKAIIFAGFRQALDSGLPLEGAGILVDETFGADIARQALAGGLVDELQLHVVPILVGRGVRLFDRLDHGWQLTKVRVIDGPVVTHLRYRVDGPRAPSSS